MFSLKEFQDEPLERIARRLDESPRVLPLTEEMIAGLREVDERSFRAGLLDADEAGLYRPAAESDRPAAERVS